MNPDISQPQMQHFAKHLAIALQKQKEQQLAREDLSKHISSVKRIAAKKGAKKERLRKAFEELEKKIDLVLKKEGKLLTASKKESTLNHEVESKIGAVESKLQEISKRDSEVIEALRSQIRNMEYELKTSERSRNIWTMENKQRISDLSNMIIDLRERLKELLRIKTEHDKKVEELEMRIKSKVSKNYIEIIKIEQMLSEMEARHARMKKEGKYDKSILREFEDKIIALKNRLFLKKVGISPPASPIPPLETEEKKEQKKIRHSMKIQTVPERQEKHEIGELPPLPPMPQLEFKPQPQKKKPIFYLDRIFKKRQR